MAETTPLVAIVTGSRTDLETVAPAREFLTEMGVPHEVRVISAHRTPDLALEWAGSAESRGIEVIIAAAGAAAALPGVVAAKSLVPVLGVPIPSTTLLGVDALLSMVQMPKCVPVGTLAIGGAGAFNAAVLAVEIVGNKHPDVRERLRKWREARSAAAAADTVVK
jgi:5-(carboxyamino)imidazole ribonucleotide mutase